MPSAGLPNYLRTHRKRACLTQDEVAFLLGTGSGASVSRHERFKQTPDLKTLLAYEVLFGAPIQSIFGGARHEVEQKLRKRIRRLIRKLSERLYTRRIEKKIELLTACVQGRIAATQG
jgi:transcriptional regulator with XRE-family HTH domain